MNFNYLKLLSFVTRSACHESFIRASTLSGSDEWPDFILSQIGHCYGVGCDQMVSMWDKLFKGVVCSTQKIKCANLEIERGAIKSRKDKGGTVTTLINTEILNLKYHFFISLGFFGSAFYLLMDSLMD